MMYRLTVITGQKKWSIDVPEGARLLDVCREKGTVLSADCGGRGACGKCTVQVRSGVAEPAPEDICYLTKRQLDEGIRLACRLHIKSDCTIYLDGFDEKPEKKGQISAPLPVAMKSSSAAGCQIAVDLGSTTLAAVLLDESGNMLSAQTAVNSQRVYGADVLSRIQAANAGCARQLQNLVRKDLMQMFRQLSKNAEIHKIAIAGNTAMLHLLQGYPCEGLGAAPFVPYHVKGEELSFEEVFQNEGEADLIVRADINRRFRGCKVCLLPCFSAFVGADIAAGLYSSGFFHTPPEQMSVFVDLGTNGELAVGNRYHFLTASTAAGPAFEGGGLSCGMPGVPGAISQVEFLFHRVRVRTIGQKKPCGICGTGALEAVAALRKEGLLGSDGLLAPELFEEGFVLSHTAEGSRIVLTQEDIRQIQLAKAAVRAGMDTLIQRYQENYPSALLDKVYIAGGFGYYLSADTAFTVGLFPKEWKEKLVICGNASLNGAVQYLKKAQAAKEMEQLRDVQQSVSLAEDKLFSEYYVEQMAFL